MPEAGFLVCFHLLPFFCLSFTFKQILTGYIYILHYTYYTPMADDRIRMPSSGGGIMRYYDEYKSKIEIEPAYVLIAIAAVVVLLTVLRFMKPLG